jgi:hypothetical protein
VEEDHSDNTLPETDLLSPDLRGGQGNPNGEGKIHAAGGNQEEFATSKAINHRGPEPSFEHIAHQDEAVQHVLVIRAVNADVLEDVVQVVRRETSARPLREDTTEKANGNTLAVAGCEVC